MHVPRIVLPSSLDITCEAFARDVREDACDDLVVLDGSAVQRVDAAGLQLVHAIVAAARKRGASIVWESVSRVIAEAATVTGLVAPLALEGKV